MANILIVGDGAIGLLFSHFLSAQHDITLLTRKPTLTTRFYQASNGKSHPIKARLIHHKELSQSAPFDLVLITVKAFQVQTAFGQVKPYLSKTCQIVLSHNGMGNVDELNTQLLNTQGLAFLTTRLAGFKTTPYSVSHTGNGESVLGACNAAASENLGELKQQFSYLPHFSVSDDIHSLRWQKLLVNIAINPLTAIHNVKNGQLRAPQFSTRIINLLSEACLVANKQGVKVKLSEALDQAYSVMTATAENFSSMQQDISHNRESEIDAICGYVCEQGAKLGVKTPYNQAMLSMIKIKS
ncbi:2-dehydropantoate 2-reductase [Pseudoalteromonas sp. XI10]|uniref:ketopantoate reductase family protein n=1 Tax=Pseudoalteromonas sp. XI10 TaxID=1766621 RepID=UPI00073355DD|nr:2-dehydropantoate 2-reductase [Pseudoalteromonas sp. XI10]KTG19146.1 2-dehydropantoate 2-reductase [Pseudoalteromonas sp. XI10]